jgi:predicted outer membrane protein
MAKHFSARAFKLNPKKKGMWKGKSLAEIEAAKAAAKRSGNVTREREAVFAINAKTHKI